MKYLVSALEMRELDRQTIEDLAVPGRTLMEVAGRAVADYCHAGLEETGTVIVACGLGNNGGDGFVAARALLALGHDVHTFIIGEPNRIKGDARSALDPLEKLCAERIHVVSDAEGLWEFASFIVGGDLVVDALLGTGLNKEVKGLLAEAIDVINDAPRPVVAVDIPSGVHADTGAVLGRAVQATSTVSFAFAKRGHYLYPGADLAGDVTVVDIGIPKELASDLGVVGRLLNADDGPRLMPERMAASHKGNFGHVVLLAGNPQFPGAAILALQGAMRAGAGLVSWATDEATLSRAPSRPAEVMLRVRKEEETAGAWVERLLAGATALVIGPGYSMEESRAEEFAEVIAQCTVPLCIDADGLNRMAAEPDLWKLLKVPVVITPHPKELSRLAKSTVDEVQRDRFASAIQHSMNRSCVTVLKGAGTVIAEADGGATVVAAGNPGMATGGTGDVLAGMVGGLLAQGLDAGQAAQAGVLLHAVAGDHAAEQEGVAGMGASDLIDSIGAVLKRWER